MALIALDNLAEVLLFDHVEACFLASDDSGWLAPVHYKREKRDQIHRSFKRKVAMASRAVEGPFAFSYPAPILDETDAAIFRIAHQYRNDIYHAGYHNPAVLAPLCRLYAVAIARAYVRSIPVSWLGGGDALSARLQGLERWGVDPDDGSFVTKGAADAAMAEILAMIPMDIEALRGGLADDLDSRSQCTRERYEALADDGLTLDGVEIMLRAAQLWTAHRGDEQIIQLQVEQKRLVDSAIATEDSVSKDALGEALRAAKLAEERRMDELRNDFEFQFDIDALQDATAESQRIRESTWGERLLIERYYQTDHRLRQIERAVGWIERAWDREKDFQSDLARGK